MLTTSCQACGHRPDGPHGRCTRCGGVALVQTAWTPLSDGWPPTPLIPSRVPGLEGALLKVEGTNPTGSFKDRVMQVLVADAVRRQAPAAVVASSGNAAVAAAAACARAGLPLLVLVPEAVSASVLKMVELRGATVVCAGEGPSAVHALAAHLSAHFDLPNLASTFSAAGCEWACRGIGHEIARQTMQPVSHLVAPVSVGPVLIGAGNGMVEAGLPLPALVAAQATGCAPIAAAYACGAEAVSPWTAKSTTAALAIADRLTGYADEASFALARIRASGGLADAVTDAEMLEMRHSLARYDGLDVELASCAAPAVWRRRDVGGHGVVCILTGAGTKETLSDTPASGSAPTIEQFAERSGTGAPLVKEVRTWIHSSRS